jgi:hypothetical protein
MAKFLTTAGTSYHVETLLISAKQSLGLISPYLQLSPILSQRLKDASDRGVEIIVVYGKNDLKPKEQAVLEGLPKLSLYYLENLHAKCYFNETSMVITSMNLYEFSEKTNREMGILIEVGDKKLYEEARTECQSIIKAAQLKFAPKSPAELQKPPVVEQTVTDKPPAKPQKSPVVEQTVTDKPPAKPQKQVVKPTTNDKPPAKPQKLPVVEQTVTEPQKGGFCIRCGIDIPLNPDEPYCKNCFAIWAKYENPVYEEKYCHHCKKDGKTSMAKPLCFSCFKAR